MTRREELQLCAVRIAKECIKLGMYPLANEIEQALLQVEREVFERVIVYIDSRTGVLTRDECAGCGNEDDAMAGAANDEDRHIAGWLKQQKEAL